MPKFYVLQQTHGLGLCAKFRLSWFILLPCAGENPQILPFYRLGILWCLRKLNTGAQLKTLPIQRYQNRFCSLLQCLQGEIGRTISDVQKRDGQTNKKTLRFLPPRRRVKSKPHQTWHGDRDLEHVLAPPKLLGPTHSFVARERCKFVGTR